MKSNKKQLKQYEAANSRLVIKVRWVVESRNSHLKNFKALSETANQCKVLAPLKLPDIVFFNFFCSYFVLQKKLH